MKKHIEKLNFQCALEYGDCVGILNEGTPDGFPHYSLLYRLRYAHGNVNMLKSIFTFHCADKGIKFEAKPRILYYFANFFTVLTKAFTSHLVV